ncbi:MAG: sigma-54 interaction domain-containing protein [Pseudomonadota bacterium]
MLYPPTEQADIAGLSNRARRMGVRLETGLNGAAHSAVLAALRRDNGLWLFWIDDSHALPMPGSEEGADLFNALALRCGGIFAWPRDAAQLEERLRRLPAAAGELEPAEAAAGRPEPVEASAPAWSEFGLIGRSQAFRRALALVARLARYDVPVLLEGETGTGKELFARALHYLGARRARPFVPVNCAALPDTLLESELFGHVRGAFTDARSELRGLVAQAEGGTLFFDEVHCLSPKGQATLLRFLQDQQYRPLGSERLWRADVRIVAASNCALAREVAQGRFREDLLYRLQVAAVRLPALRERREDIPLLVDSVTARLCARFGAGPRRFDAASLAWLCSRPWPGNIRELENLVYREFLLSDGPVISVDAQRGDASEDQAAPCRAGLSFKEARARILAEFEAQYLRALLAQTRGNVTAAARQAGKERRVFGRLMKKHGIDRGEFS